MDKRQLKVGEVVVVHKYGLEGEANFGEITSIFPPDPYGVDYTDGMIKIKMDNGMEMNDVDLGKMGYSISDATYYMTVMEIRSKQAQNNLHKCRERLEGVPACQ